jgi:hypothetical protein
MSYLRKGQPPMTQAERDCLAALTKAKNKLITQKLRQDEGIGISYSWVKQAVQEAGLLTKRRRRGPHQGRRERRLLPGMLRHIDGSRHRQLQDDSWYDPVVILNDATSETYYAQLVSEKSARYGPV